MEHETNFQLVKGGGEGPGHILKYFLFVALKFQFICDG